MKKLIKFQFSIGLFLLATVATTIAATKNDPHLPISHCYHWLDQKNQNFLTYKYRYGDNNNGDVAFVAGTNGAIAGPGLYCAKSPSGSYSYGDRVIRLELVDDIVMLDATTGKKYCGHNGSFYSQSECNKKPWDIKFYTGGGRGRSAWYVIKDPQAIARWSANSDQLITDLTTSKTINPGGASTHFDLTIKKINRERQSNGGQKIYINQNARMSILKILTKPNLLRQIPALTVISKIANVPDSDYSKSKKIKVYQTQFKRAIADSYLSFDDFNGVLKINKTIMKTFVNLVSNLNTTELKNANLPVVMLALEKYSTLSKPEAVRLWNHALLGAGSFQLFIDEGVKATDTIGMAFATSIIQQMHNIDQIQAHNFLSLISLMNNYATDKNFKTAYTNITEDLFIQAIANKASPVTIFKKFTNKIINKKRIIQNALNKYYSTQFVGLDLITVGHLADLAQLDPTTMLNYSQIIQKMDIPASKVATYLIADDFQKGKITLPSMITLTDYITKLMQRALAERGKKGMTNTYRFVFSDIFHYFFSRVKAEKDTVKKAQLMADASDFFYSFADSLPDAYFKSYGYILTQNASFFGMNLKYKTHPIQDAFDRYQTGDQAFDTFFEEVTKYALEGSYTHYLIESADDQKAKDLLDIVINYFTSPEMDTWLASNEFSLSHKEKKAWKNMITNRKYSKRGKFVSSDVCRLSKVFYNKRKYLTKILDPQVDSDLKKMNTKIYKSSYCK
jgi:hypothetical protein